jgi:hypothetical protein
MPRPQFSLKTMLWLMACLACGLAGWIAGVRYNPLNVWQSRVIHEQAEKFERYRQDHPRYIRLERLGRRKLQELEAAKQAADDQPDTPERPASEDSPAEAATLE